MKDVAAKEMNIPIRELMTMEIKQEKDPVKVQLYYLQSVSIVDFLITKYGSSEFGQLCVHLKEGKVFEEALKLTYVSIIGSVDDLEKKWLRDLKEAAGIY